MADLLRDGIRHGALGLSFGLIYIPGCFAKTEELVYLAKVLHVDVQDLLINE